MLKDIFINLASKYGTPEITHQLWVEIESQYTSPKRAYHNLKHLENMYLQLKTCREEIADWDTVLFSLFYHDIIYKVTSKENEEKSALAAIKALTAIGYPKEKIKKCGEQIIATKSHEFTPDNDTNLFVDADMCIVGALAEDYALYSEQIRKEYGIFPDFMYNPGRIKVLQHFLDMDYIFKTPYFREEFEAQAQKNLLWELASLS